MKKARTLVRAFFSLRRAMLGKRPQPTRSGRLAFSKAAFDAIRKRHAIVDKVRTDG
jgi:hypothetical protein